MTKQLIETMEKQIGKIEKAICKFTVATNAHDMSRRHPISEDRNQLAGDVHETRQQLESILSTVTEELDAAKADMCDDAHVWLVYHMKHEDPWWICTSEADAEYFVAKGRAENDGIDFGWNKEPISRPCLKQP